MTKEDEGIAGRETLLPDWLARSLGPYRDVRRNGLSLVELTQAHIPSDRIDQLRRLGLLVLRPDSFAGRHAVAIESHLREQHGVRALKARVIHLQPAQVDALYRFKLPAWGDSVWLHHEIFASGPSAAFLVSGEEGDYPSLSERLDALKGPSSPVQEAGEGTLRGKFHRISSFHAVVHAAEDVGAFLYEASLLFPWPAIAEAAKSPTAQEGAAPERFGLPPQYLHALLSIELMESQSVFETLLAIKRRILASSILRTYPNVPSELLALWRQASERAALDLDAAHTARRDSFIAFTADERELLRAAIRRQEEELPTRLDALLQQAGPPESRWQAVENVQLPLELLYASWYLSGHEVYTLDDGARIFSALERGDVPLSRWERTIVQAALRADVSRDARWGSTPLFPGS